MNKVVIDTNVAVVANRRADHASAKCVLACINALEQVQNQMVVVMDGGRRILKEYMQNLSPSGQPGLGDAFFKWLWQHQSNSAHCEQIDIHPRSGESDDFTEFPADPRLRGFDPSDRKFVAVSVACRDRPPIWNAVDSDWWNHRQALQKHGIEVVFLCPEQFTKVS